jgi:hypothetical protein
MKKLGVLATIAAAMGATDIHSYSVCHPAYRVTSLWYKKRRKRKKQAEKRKLLAAQKRSCGYCKNAHRDQNSWGIKYCGHQ